MIRIIFFLTLLLNLGLFAWLFLNKKPEQLSNQQRFSEQLEPNSITIIANQEALTKTNDTFSATNKSVNVSTCSETNLANEEEVAFAQQEIKNISLNIAQEIINKPMTGEFLVYQESSNPESSLKTLRAKNLTPISIMRNDNRVLLGLGVFDNEASAKEHQATLQKTGVGSKILNQPNIQMNAFWLRFPELNLEQNQQIKAAAQKLNLVLRYCAAE